MTIIHRLMTLVLAVTLCSCTTNTMYHKYLPVGNNEWSRHDTLLFTLPHSMETGTYQAEIGIRHTGDYPYKDLWIGVKTTYSNSTDTIHMYLADDMGRWKGSGSTGGYIQYSAPAAHFHRSSESDSLIMVYHIMRDNPLRHVTDVGLKITKK